MAGRTGLLAKANTAQWLAVKELLRRQLPQPCTHCGQPVHEWQRWEIDHVVPRAMGGSDDLANLRAAHRKCNRQAGYELGKSMPRAHRVQPSRDW